MASPEDLNSSLSVMSLFTSTPKYDITFS
jgi:hypothetical protein